MREGEEGEGPLRSLRSLPQRKTRGQAPVPMWGRPTLRGRPVLSLSPARPLLARFSAASVMGQLLGGAHQPLSLSREGKDFPVGEVHPLSPMLLQARAFP